MLRRERSTNGYVWLEIPLISGALVVNVGVTFQVRTSTESFS